MTGTDLFLFLVGYTCSIDNDMDPEHGPASKKRKTASVIVDQPVESDKMVVDQVTDVSATFEEVLYLALNWLSYILLKVVFVHYTVVSKKARACIIAKNFVRAVSLFYHSKINLLLIKCNLK